MDSYRNEFPWVDVFKQRVSGAMFLDAECNPMYFVLCIKCGEFKNQLIEFIEFCGGSICNSFEDMNPYAAVLVNENSNCKSYKGDVFKVSYIESCYNARRCLDISDFRYNSVSNVKPTFKYMDIIYYKKYTWNEIPVEFIKYDGSSIQNNKTIRKFESSILCDSDTSCESVEINYDFIRKNDLVQLKLNQEVKQLHLNEKKTTNHNQNNKIIKNSSENVVRASTYTCKPVNIQEEVTKRENEVLQEKLKYDGSSIQNNKTISKFKSSILYDSDTSYDSLEVNFNCTRENDLMEEEANQDGKQLHLNKKKITNHNQYNKIIKNSSENVARASTYTCKPVNRKHDVTKKENKILHEKPKNDDSSIQSNKITSKVENCILDDSDTSCESVKVNYDSTKERDVMKENTNQDIKHSRLPYKHSERISILKYIIKHDGISRIKGRDFWKQMEKDKVCQIRTWQSMKNHFLNKIVLELEIYKFLTTDQIRELKQIYVSKI